MKKFYAILVLLFCLTVGFSRYATAAPTAETMKLPEAKTQGQFSLEQVIANRHSIRKFTNESLKLEQIAQLCWAAQGITDPNTGHRTAPSAGALYPMQLHVVLPEGLYLYDPTTHSLVSQIKKDIRPMLYVSSFRQQVVQDAPCILIVSGYPKKIEAKYRGKGEKFIAIEAGHIAQNIQLQATALGLGSVPVGGFDPKSAAKICKFGELLDPLYLICVGNPIEKLSLTPVGSSAQASSSSNSQQDNIRTKRVVIVVPSRYFENMEYFAVEETLQIAGVNADIASSVIGEIKGQERKSITATKLLSNIKADDYDAFIFIGGPGVKEYFEDRNLLRLVRQANANNKILAAIGIAPGIFARAGVVRGKDVAGIASQRKNLTDAGANWKNTDLEVADNIITANGPDAARRFGAAVLTMLRSQ